MILGLAIITKLDLKQQAKIKCPTINILGEYDRMIPIKEGKKLAASIPNSEVAIIPKCGHMILLEEAGQALSYSKKIYT